AMGLALGLMLGWPLGGGLIFGLALSVASTVVLLKALQDRHVLESDRGRIAVGWVIVEDIAMILALVLIPAFSGLMGGTTADTHDPFIDVVERLSGIELNVWGVLAVTAIKLLAFLGFMLVVGRRVIPWVLHLTAHTGSRELFRLAVLAIALGVAAGAAYLFGVSLALGAFFAGMILSESELSNRAAQESLPFRDAFAVLFFVSVGMLFNPAILVTHPLEVLATLFVILLGKSAIGFVLVLAIRRSVGTALAISASLAQIGEFSFILGSLGLSLKLLPPEAQSYILAGSIISIVLNPLLIYAAEALRTRLEVRAATSAPIVVPNRVEPELTFPAATEPPLIDAEDERAPVPLSGHAVLIGYGRVGTVVAEGLARQRTAFVLIEDSEKRVAAAHAAGLEVVVGNAAAGKALELANIAGARTLFVAIPNAFEAGQAVEQARHLNAGLRIIARAHSDEEEEYLRSLGANEVIMGEREIGLGMLGLVRPPAESAPADAPATSRQPPQQAASVAVAPIAPLQPVVVAPVVEEPVPVSALTSSPALSPELLEARIEAAHPEHDIGGPAEPLSAVPALGEMPAAEAGGAAPTPSRVAEADTGSPAAPAPARPRPLRPSTRPGSAFDPETIKADD
ncbi:MAG TPA: cation:proton antiporter, partial [Devosia sp.]|nr:cation:proton antiporter [Devosia sp.]